MKNENEILNELLGSDVKSVLICKEYPQYVKITTINDSYCIATLDGADLDISEDDLDIKNDTISNINMNNYEIEINFQSGKTLNIKDSSGEEGLEIYNEDL